MTKTMTKAMINVSLINTLFKSALVLNYILQAQHYTEKAGLTTCLNPLYYQYKIALSKLHIKILSSDYS